MCETKIYITWLKQWFLNQNNLSHFPDECENKNYFEMGLINSFQIIELIEATETEFKIQFNNSHFQDRRFSSIQGLAEIISQIKQEYS